MPLNCCSHRSRRRNSRSSSHSPEADLDSTESPSVLFLRNPGFSSVAMVSLSVAPYSSSLLAFSPFPHLLGPGFPFESTVLFIILTVEHLYRNPLLTSICGISEMRLRVAVTDTSQTMMILFGIWSTEINFPSGSQDLKLLLLVADPCES
jgi:hypothetical protein